MAQPMAWAWGGARGVFEASSHSLLLRFAANGAEITQLTFKI